MPRAAISTPALISRRPVTGPAMPGQVMAAVRRAEPVAASSTTLTRERTSGVRHRAHRRPPNSWPPRSGEGGERAVIGRNRPAPPLLFIPTTRGAGPIAGRLDRQLEERRHPTVVRRVLVPFPTGYGLLHGDYHGHRQHARSPPGRCPHRRSPAASGPVPAVWLRATAVPSSVGPGERSSLTRLGRIPSGIARLSRVPGSTKVTRQPHLRRDELQGLSRSGSPASMRRRPGFPAWRRRSIYTM